MANTTIVSGGSFDLTTTLATGTSIEFINSPEASGILQIEPGAFENLTVVASSSTVISTYLGGPVVNFQPGDTIIITSLASDYAEFDHAPEGVTAAQNAEVSTGIGLILTAEGILHEDEILTISSQGSVSDNTGLLEGQPVFGQTIPASVAAYIDSYATSIEQALFNSTMVGTEVFITIAATEGNPSLAEAIITTAGTVAVCYLRETKLLTPNGEVAVETLSVGDLLVTRSAGFQKIKWLGEQRYDSRFVARNRNKIPVRIKAGALAEGVPVRDLYVSPGHSLLLDGVLVLARNLVNGVTITQEESAGEIHYYQVEFERHDCVMAEGAWSESFADGPGLRNQFHNVAEFYALYPDYVAPNALALCAPRPEQGAALDTVLRPVLARAAGGSRVGGLRGFVDLVTPAGIVEGWAQDMGNPEFPVLLEVFADDVLLGSVLACDYRADLEAAGIGSGRCMFSFNADRTLAPSEQRSIAVRRGADGAALAMSEACLGLARQRAG